MAWFALWGLLIGLHPFYDNSFITHLATGRLILSGEFPREDLYTYTASGTPWVVQSWFASVLYAGTERIWDSNAIHVLTAGLGAAIGAASWALTKPAVTQIPRLAVGGVVMAIQTSGWSERPLIIGFAGLAVVLLALERRVSPVWLLPVMWVWVNSHGSYPYAILVAAAFSLGTMLDGEDASHELRVARFAVLGTLLGVLGPLGLQVLSFPFSVLGRSDVMRQIVEWQAPEFADLWTRLFLLQVVAAVLVLAWRPRWRFAVPLVVFVPAALVASRNISMTSLILLPGMCEGLTGLGQVRGARRSWSLTVLVLLSALLGVGAGWHRLASEGWDFGSYPLVQLQAVRTGQLVDPESRLVTEDLVGNLQEGLYGRDASVFIDDRFDMFPREVIDEYMSLVKGLPGWDQVIDKHSIGTVIWRSDEPLVQLLIASPDWRIVFDDSSYVIACRRTSESCRAPTWGDLHGGRETTAR